MVLGIDYGTKRIGLATGDENLKVAFAKSVINNNGLDLVLKSVVDFCLTENVNVIVIGLPLNEPEHDENPILGQVKIFTNEVAKLLPDVKIELVDERFTSFQADELMLDIEEKLGKGKSLGRDAYAAQAILQHYFDKT